MMGTAPRLHDVYPLTPVQSGMLFDMLHRERDVYVGQFTCALRGAFDVNAFETAWNDLAARHDVLRSTIVWEGMRAPVQAIGSAPRITIEHRDWQGRTHGDRETALAAVFAERREKIARSETLGGIDLVLLKQDRETWQLIWTYPQLLLDGWSVAALLREAFRQTGDQRSSETGVPFKHYVKWVMGRNREAAEAFWKSTLEAFEGGAALPPLIDHVVGASDGKRPAARVELLLSSEDTRALQIGASASGATPATLVHAAWALVLASYTGSDDVMFGSVAADRPPELHGADTIIGHMLSTLPVRVRFPDRQRVGDWLRHLQLWLLDARTHGHLGLGALHGFTDVSRGQPLFESLLTIENYPQGIWRSDAREGLGFDVVDARFIEETGLPLTLIAVPLPDMMLNLTYDPNRVSEAVALRILAQLRFLLVELTRSPDRRLGDLPRLPPDQARAAVLFGSAAPAPEPIPARFLRNALARPDAPAVLDAAGQQQSYRQLDRCSAVLARRLRAAGCKPGDRVGLLHDRTVGLVASLLAVMRAGASVVLLSAGQPPLRCRDLLSDAGACLLLGQSKLAAALDLDGIAFVDSDAQQVVDEMALPDVRGQDEIYLLYTSGSTGRPKGVVAHHAGVANTLDHVARTLALSPGDRLLSVCSETFDMGVLELLLPLWTGGSVILAPSSARQDGAWMADAIERFGISVLQTTPSVLRILVDSGWLGHRGLKVVAGGEPLTASLSSRLIELGATLWNGYGPTECSIYASIGAVCAEQIPGIGVPISNSFGLLLGPDRRPVPPGVPGEYMIGGAIVGTGYHGRRALTAERFLAAPDCVEPIANGARVYATGDQVRLRPDGELECLGRLDSQIKIHGNRLELGEVEALLEEHPAVCAAAVVHRRGEGSRDELRAWVVPDAALAGAAGRAMAPGHAGSIIEMSDGTELALPSRLAADPHAAWDGLRGERAAMLLGEAAVLDVGPGLFGLATALFAPGVEAHLVVAGGDAADAARQNLALHGLPGGVCNFAGSVEDVAATTNAIASGHLHILGFELDGPVAGHLAAISTRLSEVRFARVISRGGAADEAEIEMLLHKAGLEVMRRSRGGPIRAIRPGMSPRSIAGPGRFRGQAHLRAELREHLAARLAEPTLPRSIGFLDALPLNRNGKIDRSLLAKKEIDARPRSGAAPVASTGLAASLAKLFAGVLDRKSVSTEDSFFDLGGDSILAILLTSRAREIGLRITPQQIFSNPTPTELASVAAPDVDTEACPAMGRVPLLPAQRWFFAQAIDRPHHWNQAVRLEWLSPLDSGLLHRALDAVLDRHDALRTRFAPAADDWQAEIDQPGQRRVPLRIVEPGEDFETALAAVHQGFDLAAGPLFAAVHQQARMGERDRVELIAHHLVVDAMSWRVILEDLATFVAALESGAHPNLTARSTALDVYTERLSAQARDMPDALGRRHWLEVAKESIGMGSRPPAVGVSTRVRLALPGCSTTALSEATRRSGASAWELVTAALALAWTRQQGGDRVLIAVESHGRDVDFGDLDFSRTVGWFTGIFPVLLALGEDANPRDAIAEACDQLRAAPGAGFAALSKWGDDETRRALQNLPRPELSLNFLGGAGEGPGDGPFSLLPGVTGPVRAEGQRRPIPFEVEIVSDAPGLRVEIACPATDEVRARDLAGALDTALAQICSSARETEFSSHVQRRGGSVLPDQRAQLAEEIPDIEDLYPLTAAQKGMFFRSLYETDSAVYVNEFRWTVAGALDSDAFRSAWQAVVDRHTALRTSFHHRGLSEPVQIVRRHVGMPYQFLDLTHDPDWRATLEDQSRNDLSKGFDVAAAPLIRVLVARLPEGDHRVVWGLHHLILDGWCIDLLLKEVFENYAALTESGAMPPKPSPRPFRAYVEWEQRQDIAAAEKTWRAALAGFVEPTPLPGDLAPGLPAGGDVEAAGMARRELPPHVREALVSFARRQGLTLGTLAQAVWALLLHHHSRCHDIVAAITHAGRPPDLPGVETMVGMFVKSRVMRCRVDADTALLPWLHALQHRQVALRRHDYCALADLQRWSDVPSGQPLATSLVLYQNVPRHARPQDDATLLVRDEEAYVRNDFPLTFRFLPGDPMELNLLYDRRRFTEATVGLLAEQVEVLFAKIASRPSSSLADLGHRLGVLDESNRAHQRQRKRESLMEIIG
ncbi:MAG: amino acid adenylation domain-containing protein [Pseudomonadota bacterium]